MTDEFDVKAVLEAVNDELNNNNRNRLSPLHENLLEVLWQNPDCGYKDMVVKLSRYQKTVTDGHLRNQGTVLWEILTRLTEVEINKKSAVAKLCHWYKNSQRANRSQLYGRNEAINLLTRQLQEDKYRVICLTGMPKSGKSEVISAAARDLKQAMAEGIHLTTHWFHAEKVSTVEDLCKELHRKQKKSRNDDGLQDIGDPVDTVLDILRERRWIIILDDADVLYDAYQPPGTFKTNSNYEKLLRQMVRDPTIEGCLVWVSRNLPYCLLEDRSGLYKHELSSLSPSQAAVLLETKQFITEVKEERQQLIEFCDGNPGLLLAVAKKIHESFAGRVSQYMADPFHITDQSDETWIEIITRLSEDEQVLLVWLLLKPISAEEVSRLHIPNMSQQRRTQTVQYLRHRGLIKVDKEGRYQLHTPYCRHVVAQWLVLHISTKVLSQEEDVKTLSRYPILLPTDLPYQCEWQRKHVLKPIVQKIRDKKWQQQDYKKLLSKLHGRPEHENQTDYGYAIGTILNLVMTLKIPFSGLNVKGLRIHCADLREAILKNTDLAGCMFEKSTLPICFTGTLVADMAADGSKIFIGDAEGRVSCWVRQSEGFVFDKYHRFGSLLKQSVAVQRMILNFDNLIIAAGTAIYRWGISDDELPIHLMDVDDEVRSLSEGTDYVAVGLANGHVHLNDLFGGREIELPNRHQRSIGLLALDGDDHELAAVGYGDRVLLWNIQETDNFDTVQDIYADGGIIQAIQWQGNNLLAAATLEGQPSLLSGSDQRWQNFPSVQGITCLVFSRNGLFLIGIDSHGILYRWEHGVLEESARISLPVTQPKAMVLSNDGKSLLTICNYCGKREQQEQVSQVHLWEVETGYLLWELKTVPASSLRGVQLTGVSGVTPAHQRHLGEFSV